MNLNWIFVPGLFLLAACGSHNPTAPYVQPSLPASFDQQVGDDPVDGERVGPKPMCEKGTAANRAIIEHAPQVLVRHCSEETEV